MSQDYALKVDNLTKEFVLPHQRISTVKSKVVSLFRRFDKEKQLAVNGVSFDVKKGEFFGVVGRNGSGKSTLLKCMAGVYTPNKGAVHVKGKLVPFIELGVGFNPELSGRDNVYLNGALLGIAPKEMERIYDDIVEFAELGEFMDQSLKNYSSGMQVRLAFSIAIRAKADILLLDEVLAVGDAAFQQKCNDYFATLKKDQNQTVILVSHNMSAIEKYCDRALLMNAGKIVDIGPSDKIATEYENSLLIEQSKQLSKTAKKSAAGPIKLESAEILQDGKVREEITAGKEFTLRLKFKCGKDIDSADFGINIKNHDRVMLAQIRTEEEIGGIKCAKNSHKTVSFQIQNVLNRGVYAVNVGVNDMSGGLDRRILRVENAVQFSVDGPSSGAVINPKIKILAK